MHDHFAHALKIMQYNAYLRSNCGNFLVHVTESRGGGTQWLWGMQTPRSIERIFAHEFC